MLSCNSEPCSVIDFSLWRVLHNKHFEHVTPMLRDLHWLRSPERIDFKLAARLPMRAWSSVTVSLRLHPARRRFQPPPSPVVVILTAGDPTNTAVHCWRSCVSGGWKPPLEQSAARRHLNSNADCFPEPPQNLSLFPSHFLLKCFRFLVLYTVYSSGLAVLYLSRCK